jgi:hypothetical protein
MDPRLPEWDPDPLHVDDEPELRRRRPDGVPGPALVLVIVGLPLLACIAFALWWLAR